MESNKNLEEKKVAYYSNDIEWITLKEKYEEIINTFFKKKDKIIKQSKKNDNQNEEDENHWDKFYENNQDKFFKVIRARQLSYKYFYIGS